MLVVLIVNDKNIVQANQLIRVESIYRARLRKKDDALYLRIEN